MQALDVDFPVSRPPLEGVSLSEVELYYCLHDDLLTEWDWTIPLT